MGGNRPLREDETTIDVKAGLEMMLGFLFGDLEKQKRRIAELEEELAKYRNDDWTGRVTYDNVVDLIASNEDAAVRDQTRKVFEPLLKKETARKLQRDVKRKVKEMEEADGVGAVVVNIGTLNGTAMGNVLQNIGTKNIGYKE